MEDVYYNSSNIKMALENYLREIPVHQVRPLSVSGKY
jgi:uncharacterized protein (UPF0276 family)